MAKRKPHLDLQRMESEIGYKIPTYPDDEGPRFYSDLHLVPQSDYEKFEREYQQLTDMRLLKPSVAPEKKPYSRLPTHGTTKVSIAPSYFVCTDDEQKIERTGESVMIHRHSYESLYPYSLNLRFDFGLNIPLLFTEAETTRTVLVSEVGCYPILNE